MAAGAADVEGGKRADVPWRRGDALRARVLFTLGALLVWRLLHVIPLPGVDPLSIAALENVTSLPVPRMSLVALGLTPFLGAWVLTELARGRVADSKLDRFRFYLTMALAAFQAWSMASALEGVQGAVADPGFGFRATVTITLMAGVALAMWLGGEITRRGLGEGIWVLLAADTITTLTSNLGSYASPDHVGLWHPEWVYGPAVMLIAMTALIVLVERAWRSVPVATAGKSDKPAPLRLRLDHVTILPASLAQIVLSLPMLLAAALFAVTGPIPSIRDMLIAFASAKTLQLGLLAVLIPALTFALTARLAHQRETAADLAGARQRITGVPVDDTSRRLATITSPLTAITAAYLTVVSLAPMLGQHLQLVPIALSGVQLMIIVLVALHIIGQARHLLGLPLSVTGQSDEAEATG